MAATQTLIDQATCLDCGIPPGMRQSVIIYLLSQIAGVSADPQSLIDGARCIDACVPAGMLPSIAVSLLNQIEDGGGTGGGGGVTCSASSDPSGTPTGNCGLWVRLDVGKLWTYNAGTAAWDLLLG